MRLQPTTFRRLLLVAGGLALGLGTGPAVAAENPANDCLVGLKNNVGAGAILSAAPTPATCKDGDATCDGDGAKNGSCTFKVSACVNIPDVAGCTLRDLASAKVTPPKLGITVTPSGSSSVCGSPVDIVIPLGGKGKAKGTKQSKRKKMVASVKGVTKTDKDLDKVSIQCLPCPTGDTSCDTGVVPPTDCTGSNTDGGPNQLNLVVGPGGGDLDTGFSGRSHNFINVPGATLKYCLSGCDGTTDTVCHGSGATGPNSLNGLAFGPPLPLFSSNVAVCVVNRFADATIQGDVDLATGAFDASATPLNLLADTYQGNPNQVCPKCVAGKCDSGRRSGQSCTVDGTVAVNNPPNINNVQYPVSRDCLPSVSALLGTPAVSLGLTSGTSTLAGNPLGSIPCPGQSKHDECGSASCTVDCSASPDFKGGINQTCCSNAQSTPCFPTDLDGGGSGMIVRVGSATAPTPALPDTSYPKTNSGVLAATFCIPPTGSITVDGTAGLAGPGATLLPGVGTFIK